ncbi:IS1-like element ISEic1 family transposase [Edwardsiella ictaluri]|uniref:IS1-like element ISEic1 family transposase n=2 Tax=Edwardsiella ictaluri TaxID=67780 RepID=A0ABY8GFJ0_EDWIC|nr:IS1-like element ISEic1 family transposase [Edwardsiella ictaluri]AVZ83925.1 IS1-like element ISEic1 family transposase [Edwardsiella ictaluri]UCQ49153.1 IS1-like element ISEic1 family transposase [Edwardsiella ictaluri]UCQ52409.1 IS1-like element ISEic1 family transposase [Edwardsiella ictaluri]UYB63102.1 IS1-like element ISEic1 family transposase [Edwardsiella ictaluri]UYB66327.1 IS1-like element ISEic1 family transposase [Edwardsiella ictaluri]
MAKIDVVCPRCTKTQGVVRNGHSTSGAQLYRCKLCLKTFQLNFQYNAAKPNTHQSIIAMAMNGSGCRDTARVLDISLNTVLRHPKKREPRQRAQHVEPGAEVVICCEADEQWSFVRCKSNPRWLFYAYDRIRKRVLAHVFGPRNALTLQRLLALVRKFNIAFYMTDAWPVYRTLLDPAHHVVSKKYTQRIERHNLNLRTHLKRLTRRTICFSKSEEMHDKVIGWYLTINHYH